MVKGSFEGKTITVTIKTNEFKKYRHSKTLSPMQSYEKIFENAVTLLDNFWNYDQKVRAIRVRISNLEKVDLKRQLSMFDDNKIKLAESIDYIQAKYGKNKIFIASDGFSFINKKSESEEVPH